MNTRRLAAAAIAAVTLASASSLLALRAAGPSSEQVDRTPAHPVELPPVVAPSPPVVAPSPATLDAAKAPGHLGVVALDGFAERRRGASSQPLAVGDRVERSDWISTGGASSLSLAVEGGATLQVAASTRLRVEEVEPGRARVALDHGRVRAAATPGAVVGVRATEGHAAVEGSDVDFTMQAEPGLVRVVPHRNRVTLIARDERVDLQPGDGAVVRGAGAPVLAKLPRSLLLKVRWPEATAQREPRLRVDGETAPGATVRSGDAEAVADARGRFTITLPLHDGANHPRLTAEDLAGRRAASVGRPILVDRRRPRIEREGLRYEP